MKKSASIIFLFCAVFSFGTTRPVPAIYATIQLALNACVMGDTVLVQPGTYQENLTWPNVKDIKLFSTGDSSNTIIDANFAGRCITITNTVTNFIDSNTVVKGFKLKNGYSNTPAFNGVAICVLASTPVFNGLAITNCNVQTATLTNVPDLAGGVVYMLGRGIIKNCSIYNNTIYNSYGAINGGLVYIAGSGNAAPAYGHIYNTKIINNKLIVNGGSISGALISGDVDLNKLHLENNLVLDTGAVTGANMNGLIYINGNTSNTSGALQWVKSVLIAGNTFSSNAGVNVNSMGIHYRHPGACQITNYYMINVTIADNKAITTGSVAGMSCYITKQGNCQPLPFLSNPHLNIINCIFYNPFNSSANPMQQQGPSVLSIQATTTLNPQFVSQSDHHLKIISPAINAGVSSSNTPTSDIDFTPISLPAATAPDLGCYETNQGVTGTLVTTASVSAFSVCPGTPVTFTNTTPQTQAACGQTTPAGNYSNANTFTFMPPVSGSYTVNLFVIDSNNVSGGSAYIISGLAIPSITTAASPATVCVGQSATLSALSNSAISYLWFNGATSTNVVVTPTASGFYTVSVQNNYSCAATASVYVTVPTGTVTPSQTYICPGQSVTLTAMQSSTASTYLWSTGATAQGIVVTPTVVNADAFYSVTVQDGFGCAAIGKPYIHVYANAPPFAYYYGVYRKRMYGPKLPVINSRQQRSNRILLEQWHHYPELP